ncbi:TetR/AcrR family transcriptional regulator [Blastococcus sp. SYSU D00820]
MAVRRPRSGGESGPAEAPEPAATPPAPRAAKKAADGAAPAVAKTRKPAARPRPATAVAGHRGRPRTAPAQRDEESATEPAADAARPSPHRPSRRHLIVEAAIRVFARKGFAAASIQEIADEAGMVATAVYYHFAGKEELFEAALSRVMTANSAVIAEARPDDAPADPDVFKDVVKASWTWAEANPDMARLLFLHMPGGATPGSRALAREYLDRSVRRAYDYFETDPVLDNRRKAAAEHAVRTLTVRTVIGLALAVHPLQMEGGPQTPAAMARMRNATAELCARIFRGH